MMQDYFYTLSDKLMQGLQGDEHLLLGFSGEDSDFVRFNANKIRQAGRVAQRELSLDLIQGKRHAQASVSLAGELQQDLQQLSLVLQNLRAQRPYLQEDPYLIYATEVNNTEQLHEQPVIESNEAVDQIREAAAGLDLVGIWANGAMYSGFANSFGQRNWHSNANFNFDWSCYHATDKAVKGAYAGFAWQAQSLQAKFQAMREQLAIVAKPAKTIAPGHYRVYLAPSALQEIAGMMSWGGFGLKSHRTKTTPLLEMVEQGRRLAPAISITEDHARGLAPGFTSSGFIKPDAVHLIEQGQYADCLVSPRSAVEYGSVANAESEFPGSLAIAAGALPGDEVLRELDTGLYINNLWYLNFSDRNHCQITGMTRFACFWVEQGKIQAPLNVMRFDDSVYELLGKNLLGLTMEREFIFDPGTYGQRSQSSIQLPGVLVEAMNFTL